MNFIERTVLMIQIIPTSTLVILTAVWCFFLTGFINMFILPLIFNYKIIPDIEKRLGKKLKNWGIEVDMSLLGRFFYRGGVVFSIGVMQYFILIFFKSPDESIKKFNQKRAWAKDICAAGYDVRLASKFEKRMIWFGAINLLIGILSMAIFYIGDKKGLFILPKALNM